MSKNKKGVNKNIENNSESKPENGNERVYQIVGEYEANLDHGLISIASPLARAIIGKKIDDTVEVITPNGVREYQILEVEFK